IGYEVQKVLAAVDWLKRGDKAPEVELWGYGEGGLIALYTAALDDRIFSTFVSGYVKKRENLWQEPIYRNVWNLLTEFGDAELLVLAGSPIKGERNIAIECTKEPDVKGPPAPRAGRGGAAPGALQIPRAEDSYDEYERIRKLT